MVGIALALLAFSVLLIVLHRVREGRERPARRPSPERPLLLLERYPGHDGFTTHRWRSPQSSPMNYEQWVTELEVRLAATPFSPGAAAVQQAALGAVQAAMDRSDVLLFSQIIFLLFISFLLPIWSLSFATDAFGSEREGGNLIWLLTRPLPRPAIYLAKFVAVLPWSLALNVGGFGLLCLAAGRPGPTAFRLYWPAIFWGAMAFTALFHLMGAYFQRPAIVAILYSFFLETILGNMPGYMKRVSLGFYSRCMMFDAGQEYGVQPEKPSVYLPVDGTTACVVLIGVTVALLALGMYLFSRKEYQDIA
jgi:ABC-type transport system involved in multi-copper enzyme maturation permease subunit